MRFADCRRQAVILLLLCLVCSLSVADEPNRDLSEVETQLWTRLMQNYKATVLPSVSGGVKVQVGIVITGMEISTATETMELSGWWRLFWRDQRLAWNETEWGVKSLTFREGEIWSPDVTMYEKTSESMYAQERMVYPSGDIVMSTPRKSKFACPMSLSAFPFDVQKCRFTIGSWSHDGSRLDVLPRQINPANYFEESSEELPDRSPVEVQDLTNFHEWHLIAVRVVWRNNYYSCCPEPFPTVRVELEIQRATMTYVSGVVAPLIIVTCIGFGTLLMPSPASGAKPALCVTILLTTATVYFVASAMTPNSNKTTLIGRLYIACLVVNLCLVFWSIWTTALCLVQRDNSSSVQHFMDFFYHCDTERSGRLNRVQVATALDALGLSLVEQQKLIQHLFKEEPLITEEQWAVIGELAHKSDKLAVFHNPLVEMVVTGAIIRDFKKHGINVGKSKAELFTPKASAEASPEQVPGPTRPDSSNVVASGAALPTSSAQRHRRSSGVYCDPDDNTQAYDPAFTGERGGAKGIRRMSSQSAAVAHALLQAAKQKQRGSPGMSAVGHAIVAAANLSPRPMSGHAHDGAQANEAREDGEDRGRAQVRAEAAAGAVGGKREGSPHRESQQGAALSELTPYTSPVRSNGSRRGRRRRRSPEPQNWLEASGLRERSPSAALHESAGGRTPCNSPRGGGAVEITNPSPTKQHGEARPASIAQVHFQVLADAHDAVNGAASEHAVSISDLRARGEAASLAAPATPRTAHRAAAGGDGEGPSDWEGEGAAEAKAGVAAEGQEEGMAAMPRGSGASDPIRSPVLGGSWLSSRSGMSVGASYANRLDVKLGCIKRSELHFRQVLRTLGDKMDQFAGVNGHPTAVGRRVAARGDAKGRLILPLAFAIYLLIEFMGVWSGRRALGQSSSYYSAESGEKLILFEYKNQRALASEKQCFRSFFKAPAPDNDEFELSSDQTCASEGE